MQADYLRNNYLQLGVAACKAGNLSQAARFLEAGLQECERLNLKDLRAAGLLYNLAVVSYKRGLRHEVESLLLKCLRLSRRNVEKDHPALPLVSRLLATYYYESGNLKQARYYYRQILRSPSLPAPEQLGDLKRLAAIENASANHASVQKICHRIYALSGDQFKQPPANLIGAGVPA